MWLLFPPEAFADRVVILATAPVLMSPSAVVISVPGGVLSVYHLPGRGPSLQ